MSKDLKVPDSSEFGLRSFADLLRRRPPIAGEDELSFSMFHEQLMTSLVPLTPYEAVIAENLIAIEWELLLHRRMRDASIRGRIHELIRHAVVNWKRAEWEKAMDTDLVQWLEAGNDDSSFRYFDFDETDAQDLGNDLAIRVIDPDPSIRSKAEEELIELGLDALQVMSLAYSSESKNIIHHEDKIQELERRRRQVKGDLDDLQRARPATGKVIDG